MFEFLKKKKKEKKQEKEEPELDMPIDRPQKSTDGIYRGLYCPVCGYMQVNENSEALPLEGFAMCPNCGAPLKYADFIKTADGYALAPHATVLNKKKANSGGHYRVRKPGPTRTIAKAGNPIHRNKR